MIPLADVFADSGEDADVSVRLGRLHKIFAIRADKGDGGLDTGHPHIVEDHAPAHCTERRIEEKVGHRIVKAMASVNENDIKICAFAGEVDARADRRLFDVAERGFHAESADMGNANAMPVFAHVRVDGGVVAGFILGEGGKKKEC